MNAIQSLFSFTANIFLCIILSSFGAQAQESTTVKDPHYNTLQGGIFYEYDLLEQRGDTYDFSSFGMAKIGYGFLGFKNSKAHQFLLEVSMVDKQVTANQPQVNLEPGATMGKNKVVIEVEYFKSLLKVKSITNSFHAGPTLSAHYSATNYLPFSLTSQFPVSERSIWMGLGGKMMYIQELSDKYSFLVSSSVNLIDVGFSRDQEIDPNLQFENQTSISILDVNIFRPRVNLNFGLVF